MSLLYSRMMIVSCSASVALQILDYMSSRDPTSEPMKRQQLRIDVPSRSYYLWCRPVEIQEAQSLDFDRDNVSTEAM
jgi:hypothetical protein